VSDTYVFSHKRVSETRKTSSSSVDSVFSIILREIESIDSISDEAMYMSVSLCKLFNNEKTTLYSGVFYKSMSSINHKRCKQNLIFYKCLNASSRNSRSLYLSRIKKLIARVVFYIMFALCNVYVNFNLTKQKWIYMCGFKSSLTFVNLCTRMNHHPFRFNFVELLLGNI